MFLPQPYFKMGQGAIPSEYLHDNRKNKTCDMEYLYQEIFSTYECTDDQKNDPEKMDKDKKICC